MRTDTIVFTDTQWEILKPLRVKWLANYPRVEEIKNQIRTLEKEERMLDSQSAYYKALFWDKVEELFPHTKGIGLTFCGGGDESNITGQHALDRAGPPRVVQNEGLSDLKGLIDSLPSKLRDEMPESLKKSLSAVGIL